MTGKALALPTTLDRLRAQLADVERERDEWKDDALRYRGYWQALVERCEDIGRRLQEAKAELARITYLRMSA